MTDDKIFEIVNNTCTKLRQLLGEEFKNYINDFEGHSKNEIDTVVISTVTSFIATVLAYMQEARKIYPPMIEMKTTLDKMHQILCEELLKRE